MHNHIIPKRKYGGNLEPCGRVWPDGQFTMGYAHGAGLERLETAKELAEKMVPLLGLAIDSNSHSSESYVGSGFGTGRDSGKPSRGQKGITSHQRKLLSNAVSFLQRRHGRKRLSFVTLTLPNLTFEESWNVASNWSQIIRVFFQRLGRWQKKVGITPHYASCTEMQPKRAEREEHPALHLHFVMLGKARGQKGWAFTPEFIRLLWRDAVKKYLYEEKDWSACENVQQVKRNAAAYLSKYVSKGSVTTRPPSPYGTGWKLPSQWINVSSKLRRWILDRVMRSPEFFLLIEQALKYGDSKQVFHYVGEGVIPDINTPGPHFYYGRIRGPALEELIDIWFAGQGAPDGRMCYNRERSRLLR